MMKFYREKEIYEVGHGSLGKTQHREIIILLQLQSLLLLMVMLVETPLKKDLVTLLQNLQRQHLQPYLMISSRSSLIKKSRNNMADYDFESWAQSRIASSKPNPNQQAASSMRSVGIGGLGGRTTTSGAQKIQDNFKDL